MKGLTYIAGAAVAAMVAMTAIPNDAAAVPIAANSSFGFVPLGAVTFNGGALTDIALGITSKAYPDAIVNILGDLSFAGIITAASDITPEPLTFDVPQGQNDPLTAFSIAVEGFTFTFTEGDLHTLSPTTDTNAGALVADYQGTVTAAPLGFDTGQFVQISQSCDQAELGVPVNCSNTLTVAPGQQVPEPASLALLGASLAGFALFRRRRKTG